MKRKINILLSVIMLAFACMTFLVPAWGGETEGDPNSWTSAATKFTFEKDYTVTGNTAEGLFPAETLSFTVEAGEENPDNTMITVGTDNTWAITDQTNTITVNVPSYKKIGIYTYTIKEVEGNTQGVTYTGKDTQIGISVLVSYNYTDKCLDVKAGVTLKEDAEEKEDTIGNEYDLGNLEVSKEVTGNLGDQSKYFDIDVTFTKTKDITSTISYTTPKDGNKEIFAADWGTENTKTVTISLKHGDTAVFHDIPAGITYEVAEQSKHTTGAINSEEGYTATYTGKIGTVAKDETKSAKVTNQKGSEINTGISLDTLPYIIVLAVVVIAGVLLIIRRRRNSD